MPRKSKRLQAKKNKDTDRRVSVGDALGVPDASTDGDNLNEVRALDAALAAARRLNELAASGEKDTASARASRRSSAALLKQTRTSLTGIRRVMGATR